MTPNTRLHAPHRTSHPRPPPRPPPRLGGKEMRRWDSEGGVRARMGGFSNAPRCPASLTFRDSPALLRRESDGYPVRACCSTRRRPPIPPSSFPPRILRTPTSRPTLGLCPARPRPFCPSLTPRPDTHIQDKPGVLLSKEKKNVLLSKEKKNGKEETSGGDSPPMQHPREGLPSPKLCLSITPKPAAARGALGAACRTAVARG